MGVDQRHFFPGSKQDSTRIYTERPDFNGFIRADPIFLRKSACHQTRPSNDMFHPETYPPSSGSIPKQFPPLDLLEHPG
jgi:hypothetical protein